MTKFVAFLLGINSGKNPTVKMKVLRKVFGDIGFENVRTILASGNILFETDSTFENTLEQKIEKMLPETIGFKSDVIVRTIDDLHKLVLLNPFNATEATPQTRPYVTFVKGELKKNIKFPARGKGYTILGILMALCAALWIFRMQKHPT